MSTPMTTEQLNDQTIAAFAAWRKNKKTPIEYTFTGESWTLLPRAHGGDWSYPYYRIHDTIAPGHNPDKLRVSQVGEGWRLLDEDEMYKFCIKRLPGSKYWLKLHQKWVGHESGFMFSAKGDTVRTRLSRSELAALDKPAWKLTRHLPGFRPLEDGEEWHREDFTEEDLAGGWRPMMTGEVPESGDEYKSGKRWRNEVPTCTIRLVASHYAHRTRRPLPPIPAPSVTLLSAVRAALEDAIWMHRVTEPGAMSEHWKARVALYTAVIEATKPKK